MGKRLVELARQDPELQLAAALTVPTDPRLGEPALPGADDVPLTDRCRVPFDLLIDFSLPDGTMQWMQSCEHGGAAFLSGTTGLSESQRGAVRSAGRRIPVLWSSNFSLGVHLLGRLAAEAVRELGPNFDVEIIETHHNRKLDAPSGTAGQLAHTVAQARGREVVADFVHGRFGEAGPRPRREIGIHSVRLGDEIGRHEIHFGGQGETLVLQHTVRSRDTFARGAIQAAKWLVHQEPGFYTMDDFVGSRRTGL